MSKQQIIDLYATVRADRQRFLAGVDRRDVRRIGALYAGLKKHTDRQSFFLDEGQRNLYALSQTFEKGESAVSGIVSYLRVSTKRQGKSGLGLDSQRESVLAFVQRTGDKVLREFVEVESGKRTDRPELAAALAYARRAGATLVVAKIDRLSRNLAFLTALMQGKVPFLAVDNPHATPLTVHILAAVAEYEANAISQRTKDGLAQAKARGVKLGSQRPGHWDGREDARRAGAKKGNAKARKVIAGKAREEYEDLFPLVKQLRAEGLSFQKIADALNAAGHTTRTGRPFSAPGARRVVLFAGAE